MAYRLALFTVALCGATSPGLASPRPFLTRHGNTDSSAVLLPLTRRLQTFSSGAKRNFYVGNVRAGHGAGGGEPQELLAFFDTGSGQVLLDSTRCKSIPCLQHHQYSPEASSRAVGAHVHDMDSKGNPAPIHASNATMYYDMADDSTTKRARVTGDLVRDTMCLGFERNDGSRSGEACADVGFVAATTMSDELFLDAPFDGIVGLSLEGLSISKECNWFSRLVAAGFPARFALFLPPANSDSEQMAEIAFGGHNPARLAAPLTWLPVVKPEAGYWQLRVTSVRIGDQDIDICAEWPEGCLGIVDTSSPSLGLPEEIFPELPTLPGAHCEGGPDILLTFAGQTTLNITSKDYMEHVDGLCVSQLHSLTSQDRSSTGVRKWNGKIVRPAGLSSLIFILGEPLLRRYYTVFDTEAKQIGFGLSASAAGKPAARQVQTTSEIILMQQRIVASRAPATRSAPDQEEL